MKFVNFSVYAGALALVAGTVAHAGDASQTIEVVESVPIETTLAVPGIRDTQTVWLEMIAAAKKTIDLEEFYVQNQAGQPLEPVLNALQAATKRGVQIRLLVDSKFYKQMPTIPDQFSTLSGMQVKTIDFSATGGIMHAKYFVVDGTMLYEGSANFDWLALEHIHEVGIRLNDAATAAKLESVFERDWADGEAIGRALAPPAPSVAALDVSANGFPGVKFVASPPSKNPNGIDDTLDAVTTLMSGATRSVKIQVYEYNTKSYTSSSKWQDLDRAIRKAASNGAKVQLLVDANALKAGKADLTALKGLKNIQVKIVTIPEWSGGHLDFARLVHSKYLLVDDATAWVGSENWSEGYFTGSRNVGLVVTTPDAVKDVGRIFDQVWSSSYSAPL